MSDQLRDALTLAQEKRDRADVEHRLAALLHELASGADFACPPPRRLPLHPRTTEKSFSAPAAPSANRPSAPQLQEAWTKRGPRRGPGLTTSPESLPISDAGALHGPFAPSRYHLLK